MADLLDTTNPPVLVPTSPPAVTMFERLAADPNVPVDKLEKLIALQERIAAHDAEASFNGAFAQMQAALPTVTERGRSVTGPYATLEDIIEAVRPVLHRFGFALSHRSEFPDSGRVKVTALLTHRDGHAITSEFIANADTSGSKNAIQALGSAVSYGRRYTTKDLLNIATRGEDDNGRHTGAPVEDVPAPAGFEDWLTDLGASADLGRPALDKVWNESKGAYKTHLVKTNRKAWEAMKTRAAQVAR
jgi:hypothetical protein